ncbi:MAG: LysM peptidoglycan-binding domain-containing protein [Paludibacter sp.]|nr:LysM peptidoglycan-binding domain-containing protein [Paludibacter sp.]
MKKQLFRFILAGFLLLPLLALAQNNNYPVTTVNGVEYYQYTVQPSEGLLAIGRKFKISKDEIIKASPEVKEGLKVGQQILIPVPKKAGKKSVAKSSQNEDFILHKVDKKQTLFSISRKYNVSESEIVKNNPGIEKGLHDGIVLKIPKQVKDIKKKENEKTVSKDSKAVQADTADKKTKYTTHKVQPEETLFSISRRYKVEIPDIIKINPGSDSKLVVGSDLKIPSKEVTKPKAPKKDSIELELKATKENNKEVEKPSLFKSSEKKTIRIAFLLPFMLDQPKTDQSVDRFVNFYEGALLAINEAKQKGISFEVYTYDTEKSEERVTEILNNPELKAVDLIIGPAFSNQVPIVEDFAKENKINTLIPFTSKVPDIDSNPYLFQFNPGPDTELDMISDLISGKYKNCHIVFAELEDISPLDDGRIRVETLKKKMTKEHRNFSTIDLINPDNVNFKTVLHKGDKNLIIFNSDKFSNVGTYINALTTESETFDILLFKQYNWRSQSEKTPAGIFISPFITKFNTESVDQFNSGYDRYFGKDVTTDSPRYDLLGYDLSNYFISVIHRNGGKFGNKINSNNLIKGIQSEPLFERTSANSGFINQRVYLGEDKAQ